MVFDQCVSCPSCPLPSTAKAQWPGNRVWCNQGIWISKKKYLETLASAFAAQQYCAAKRVAKKLKTFKKFAFAAGSCSLLCVRYRLLLLLLLPSSYEPSYLQSSLWPIVNQYTCADSGATVISQKILQIYLLSSCAESAFFLETLKFWLRGHLYIT